MPERFAFGNVALHPNWSRRFSLQRAFLLCCWERGLACGAKFMAKKSKKTARPDRATEEILLAEEDLAAMRPALAVAPELVVQALSRTRRRRAKPVRKKTKTARKSSTKKARKASPKKRKKKTAGRK
jgi:hypothetical protein